VPVETIGDVHDITFALPAIVGGDGIISVLPAPLNDTEERLLEDSAHTLRQALDELVAAGNL
jgi:malate/lactate dehydrogenase